MGKRYYCDYCDKTMVASPSIIRTHNKGVVHQKLVSEHYQQYKDPSTILSEESNKKPCVRFARGECQFGGICRFSHYTQEQINTLKQYVAAQDSTKLNANQPSFEDLYQKLQTDKITKSQPNEGTAMYDRNGVTHIFPWVYNPVFDSFGESLPPSLKRLKIDDFINASFTEWG
ncbi:unnamed protein product [Parnassius apollo]|uniref:(apollo) hypothetical protein n=1 Tax=Parnassius apollo TaxID=110799 RepID=A0A8S3X3B8_PARAO|nr:unnamed protein product [Parnassius apollo]